MRQDKSGTSANQAVDASTGIRLELALPLGDIELFRHGASEEILNVLALHPHLQVSTRHLSDLVGYSEKATRRAVDTLEQTNLIETEREGNRRLVSIATDSLEVPDDPLNQIPQPEFRLPTRLVLHKLGKELEDVIGVLLFGSVARGEATLNSDIDLWVLVQTGRQQQLHSANKVSKEMSGLQIPPKVGIHRSSTSNIDEMDLDFYLEMIENTQNEWSSVPAPDFEILVETPQSALNQKEQIDTDMFVEGITLQSSETLENVIEELMQ